MEKQVKTRLEAGKTYTDRAGRSVTLKTYSSSVYPFLGSNGYYYMEDGRVFRDRVFRDQKYDADLVINDPQSSSPLPEVTKHDDGGFAFPIPGYSVFGMTLLDWFAAQEKVRDVDAREASKVTRLPVPGGSMDTNAAEWVKFASAYESWARYEKASAMVAEKRRREAL